MEHPTNIVIPDANTEALLRLAVVRDQSPIESLLDALSAPGGATIVEGAPTPFEVVDPAAADDRARPDLETLDELKRSGKRTVARAEDDAGRRLGSWAYILSAASALAYHGRRISSTPDTELKPIFLELAELLPAPWSPVFAAAAERCRGSLGTDGA